MQKKKKKKKNHALVHTILSCINTSPLENKDKQQYPTRETLCYFSKWSDFQLTCSAGNIFITTLLATVKLKHTLIIFLCFTECIQFFIFTSHCFFFLFISHDAGYVEQAPTFFFTFQCLINFHDWCSNKLNFLVSDVPPFSQKVYSMYSKFQTFCYWNKNKKIKIAQTY